MTRPRDCSKYGDTYTPYHGKPGLITECPKCGAKNKQNVALKEARVSWEGKHTPIVEIVEAGQATAFNACQRRFGTTVVKSFGKSSASGTYHSTDWGHRR